MSRAYLISIHAASVANSDSHCYIVSWLDGGGRDGEVRVLKLGERAVCGGGRRGGEGREEGRREGGEGGEGRERR